MNELYFFGLDADYNSFYSNEQNKQLGEKVAETVVEKNEVEKDLNAVYSSNYLSTQKFCSKFMEFYEENFKNFKELALPKEDLQKILMEMSALSKICEFNADQIFDEELLHSLTEINEKIKNQEFVKEDLSLIIKTINMALLFSAITPLIIKHSSHNYVEKKSVEAINVNLLHQILNVMKGQEVLQISTNHYLSHLVEKEFDQATLAQKMLLMNLANFNEEIRKDVIESETFKFTYKQPDLMKWMFACSGSLEQDFLNTCASASFCQALVTRLLILPQLFPVTDRLLNTIRSKMRMIRDPEIYKYVEKRLVKEKGELSQLTREFLSLSPNAGIEDIHHLTLKWSRIMQRVGLLIVPHAPSHPTSKPISDAWLASAVIMIPVVLLEHGLGHSENPPQMAMRTQGARMQDLSDATSTTLHHPRGLEITRSQIAIIEGKAKEPSSEAEKERAILSLWKSVHSRGGIIMQTANHYIYLKTLKHEGQLFFLIGDPKRREYEVKTPGQLLDYIKINEITLGYI